MSDCTKGCDASCNSGCGCGSTHHHCGCPCHVPESDEAAYARNERVMLAAADEVLRLKPIVGRRVGEPVPVDERQQMRAVIEAMRPIVEAAMRWKDAADDPGAAVWKETETLDAAIESYRRSAERGAP